MDRAFLEKILDRIDRMQPDDVQSYLLELAREKGFLETIFNAILEGVIVVDRTGRLVYLNRAACGFFGIDERTSIGQRLSEVVKGLDWEAIARGGETVSRDLETFYPDSRLLNFYVVPLKDDESGGQAGSAIILRDITENRKATEETIESERFSALTLLAAGVAHEIGNPLNSLDIHLQLIQRRLRRAPARLRAELEESLEVARQEVGRLDHIITQFLRAIRPQSLSPTPSNLNRIVEESLHFLDAEIRDRDILVETELEHPLPTAEVDQDQIKQAFYNVIRNAFQAMKSGGILRVKTKTEDAHIAISFSDTGGGIPSENISRIFEPYFTTKTGGSGLGLLIVRRIIRSHGGELAIESTEGRGLTVTIRIPRADHRVRMLTD